MADTLPNITLPKGVWVDLYDESGITVGVQIVVQSLSSGSVRLSSMAAEPSGADGFQLLNEGIEATNGDGDLGAWAMSMVGGAVNVRIA